MTKFCQNAKVMNNRDQKVAAFDVNSTTTTTTTTTMTTKTTNTENVCTSRHSAVLLSKGNLHNMAVIPTLVFDDGEIQDSGIEMSSERRLADDFAELSVADVKNNQAQDSDTTIMLSTSSSTSTTSSSSLFSPSPSSSSSSTSSTRVSEKGRESSEKIKQMASDLLLYLRDTDGDTSLHISIVQNNEVMSMKIINRAPDFLYLNITNTLGQTPAHLAVLTKSTKIVRRLMCAGADIAVQDTSGNTPLHVACLNGYLEMAAVLLRPIFYTETLDNKYPTPFTSVPQNLDIKNYDGLSCLHLAVMGGHFDIVRLLVQVGVDINLGDSKSGRTALHLAAENNMTDILNFLLSIPRTNVNAQTYSGYTPGQMAESLGHLEATEMLNRRGASILFYSHRYNISTDESDIDIDESY